MVTRPSKGEQGERRGRKVHVGQEPVSEEEVYGDPRRPRVAWGLREIGFSLLLIVGAYILVVAAIALPASAILGEDSTAFKVVEFAVNALFEALIAAGVIWLALRSGATFGQLGLRKPVQSSAPSLTAMIDPSGQRFPWGYTAGLSFAGLIVSFAAFFGYLAIVNVMGLDSLLKPSEQIDSNDFNSLPVTIMIGFAVLIVAPISEEIYFRGFLFGGLRGLWGFVPGALASGFVFSLVHAQIGLIIPFTLIGFIFAYLYQMSRSLIPSIGTHFLFNLLGLHWNAGTLTWRARLPPAGSAPPSRAPATKAAPPSSPYMIPGYPSLEETRRRLRRDGRGRRRHHRGRRSRSATRWRTARRSSASSFEALENGHDAVGLHRVRAAGARAPSRRCRSSS